MKIIVEIAANAKYCAICGCLELCKAEPYCTAFNEFVKRVPAQIENHKFTRYARCKACKRAQQEHKQLLKEKLNANANPKPVRND